MLTLPKETEERISVRVTGKERDSSTQVDPTPGGVPSFAFVDDPGDDDWTEGTWETSGIGNFYALIQVGQTGAGTTVELEPDVTHPIRVRWETLEGAVTRKAGFIRLES